MTAPTTFALLTAIALFVAACIFMAQTVLEIKQNRRAMLKSFNLWMTVFMLTWSVTEFFEDILQPPYSIFWQYLHVVVMVSFAIAITWRWQWVASKTERLPRVQLVVTKTVERRKPD